MHKPHLESLPIISSTSIVLPDRREGPNIVDQRQTELAHDVLALVPSAPPPVDDNREPDQRKSSPSERTRRVNGRACIRAWRQRPPPPNIIPITDVHISGRDDQVVSDESAVGSHLGPSIGIRIDGGSRRCRSRENVIETAYFTHTDAGAVRVVELPPSYNELPSQSTHRQ